MRIIIYFFALGVEPEAIEPTLDSQHHIVKEIGDITVAGLLNAKHKIGRQTLVYQRYGKGIREKKLPISRRLLAKVRIFGDRQREPIYSSSFRFVGKEEIVSRTGTGESIVDKDEFIEVTVQF